MLHAVLAILLSAPSDPSSGPAAAINATALHELRETLKAVRAERDLLRESLRSCREAAASAPHEPKAHASTSLASRLPPPPSPSPALTKSKQHEHEHEHTQQHEQQSASPFEDAPAPPPRHHHPPHHPPHPRPTPPTAPPARDHAGNMAALEKGGPPCPIEWGSRRDGTRLKSSGDTTLSGCCALCRTLHSCDAFNFDANQGAGRCYLLSGSTAARQVRDVNQRAVYSSALRAEGCSCAKIGAFAG